MGFNLVQEDWGVARWTQREKIRLQVSGESMVDWVSLKSLRHPSPLGNGFGAPREKPGGHGAVCHGRNVLSGGCRERGGPAFPASVASLHLWAWLQGHACACCWPRHSQCQIPTYFWQSLWRGFKVVCSRHSLGDSGIPRITPLQQPLLLP